MSEAVLNGQGLPSLTGYREKRAYRGAMIEMADGTAAFDLVQPNSKRVFELNWQTLTSAEKGAIETLFAAMQAGSVTFSPPTGEGELDVTRTATGLDFVAVATATGLRWAVTMELREV